MSRDQRILNCLQVLNPLQIEVINDSQSHAGHQGVSSAVTPLETHYQVFIVSDEFAGLSRIDRQRKVNDLLRDEFQTGLHALQMKLKTPQEI